MKVIGVATTDFSFYYDVLRILRSEGLPFTDLVVGEEVPPHVAVVITTPAEAHAVLRAEVVASLDALDAVEAASLVLMGRRAFRHVIVGVDPGERPGVAVLGDGHLISTVHATHPEAVAQAVLKARSTLSHDTFTVRVGNGAPAHRDRILRALLPSGVTIELVDEARSTPSTYSSNAERDITAAKAIALARGALVPQGRIDVRPPPGEIRDVQRKSRIASLGRFTIDKGLARQVLLGHLTMDQAVERHRSRAGG